ARQQGEMIILNQNEWLFRTFNFLQHGLCEFLVYTAVMLPIANQETWARVRNVAQRPDPLVGKTEIVAVLLFLGKPDAAKRIVLLVGRHPQTVAGIHRFAVRVTGAVGNPGAIASIEDRFQSRH